MELNTKSVNILRKVHPDLQRVVRRAAKEWKDKDTGFVLTCGGRTVEAQKQMVAKGASTTMRSRHIIAPNGWAHAVDLAFIIKGVVKWDWPLYSKLAAAMKLAAVAEKVPVEWGGDWKKFKDGPHFQLSWKQYLGTK